MITTLRRPGSALIAALPFLTLGTVLFARKRARTKSSRDASISVEEAREIATEAYLYAYPLVIAELTRRASIGKPGGVPMNQVEHLREFPDADFTRVVRPNADTLYSTLWYDVSKKPIFSW